MANEAPASKSTEGNNKLPKKPAPNTAPIKKQAPSSGLETVLLRNNFYRDNFRRLMTFCLLLILTIVGLSWLVFYQYTNKPAPTYFATTVDGKLFQMESLDRPLLSQQKLNIWVVEAAVAAYSYNFVNYREALQAVKKYFTNNGYNQLMSALAASKNLEAVKTKKLVASAVPTAAPIILNQGIINGRYAWRVQLPLKVTYQSASELIPQSLIVTVLVTRVPVWESAEGIGIESFIVREGQP